jgi:hypothetical protein
MFNSNKIFYDRIRIRWPFNTGDCLIEVTAWAGMTVYVSLTRQSNSSFSEKKSWMQVVNFFYPSYAGHSQWYGFSVLVQNDNKTSKVAIGTTNLGWWGQRQHCHSYFSIGVEIRFPRTCSALYLHPSEVSYHFLIL